LSIRAQGQMVVSDNRRTNLSDAKEQYKSLRSGYLIVILPSYRTQTDHYEKVLASQPDKKTQDLIAKKQRTLFESRDKENNEVKRKFERYYQFSPVRFIYDNDYVIGDRAHNNHFFLNRENKPEVNLSIGEKPFLIAGEMMSHSNDKEWQDFYITYPDLTRLPEPFPDRPTKIFRGIADLLNLVNEPKSIQTKLEKFGKKYD